MTGEPRPADESIPASPSPGPPVGGREPGRDPAPHARPSIAQRAARRAEVQAAGRDRYATLIRSLQAGREVPLHRRGARVPLDWHPVLWTLVRVAVVIGFGYLALRTGLQWWRESHVETWSGPDAAVQSGVRLDDCPIIDAIRVDDFPSWITFEGSIYRYAGWKRPYVGPGTPGYATTPYATGAMRLVLIENTPDGVARDTVLVWLDNALAGVEYLRTPDCSAP